MGDYYTMTRLTITHIEVLHQLNSGAIIFSTVDMSRNQFVRALIEAGLAYSVIHNRWAGAEDVIPTIAGARVLREVEDLWPHRLVDEMTRGAIEALANARATAPPPGEPTAEDLKDLL